MHCISIALSLDKSIEYLKGVGPIRADTLKKEAGIFVYDDLLNYFPFRYVDKSKIHKIYEVKDDTVYYQLKGRVLSFAEVGEKNKKRLVVQFEDDSGRLELVWFKGYKFILPNLVRGNEYFVFGKATHFNGRFNFTHPEIEAAQNREIISRSPLQGIYSSGEKLAAKGLTTRGFEKLEFTLINEVKKYIPEILPDKLMRELELIGRADAYEQIHFPDHWGLLQKAQYRLKFDELFFIQMQLVKQKVLNTKKLRGFLFEKVGHYFNTFFNEHLPFSLTEAQKRVLREIRRDVGTGAHMNRLMQGDVGSGKTIVALLTMLLAIDNGFQACLMAPTEILAQQHFKSITDLLKDLPVTVDILTGSSKTSDRKRIDESLRNGNLNILIGTHALIEPDVVFSNLGMVIIDEQHRFGVEQRSKLWKKNSITPHVLVMTATPIPRTLAMTLYGDLDVSVIDELPPGRRAIKTDHRFDSARIRVFDFMEKEIANGRQVYVVYPLIQESEKADYKDLMDGYESIVRRFPMPRYQVSIVHGKMKAKDKDWEMDRFVKGQTQIMVATTVIEVGVNVPNASIMVIESAERFGLSQLHQLRGRVGRGAEQSYCILMTGNKLGEEARHRMKVMCETNDGFVISEEDMKLRGPGDITGTAQSGLMQMKIADITKDGEILLTAREKAIAILESDPDLTNPENKILRDELMRRDKHKSVWARIS
ncbi:MAG TPA: ATP-dependent DNA helicase RecG [Flavobacteriales bacterium]|nr:ATP-dependent DNA helicase RecG [Flavobacteriales bacterium]